MGPLLELTAAFFQIGLFSIGGGYAVIPLIRAQVVDKFHWISERTFTDIITISQMTPGPLAVNTSTFVGLQVAGVPGAALATAGCVASGALLSLLLYRFFERRRASRPLSAALSGLKASSLGLIAAATLPLLQSALLPDGGADWAALLLFLGALVAQRRFRVHPVLVMLGASALGYFLY